MSQLCIVCSRKKGDEMKKYIIIFLNQFSVKLSYKFNLIVRLLNNIISILLSVFTWRAIFNSSGSETIGNFSQSQMILYIVLVNFSIILFSSDSVTRLGHQVRTGKLTMHLLRPYSYLLYNFAEQMGAKLIHFIIYFVAIFIGILNGFTLLYVVLLILLLLVNIIMFFLFVSLISNLGFWLIQMWPMRAIFNACYALLGGLLFPLNLYPEAVYRVIKLNPFALVGYHYTKALQFQMPYNDLVMLLGAAIVWSLLIYVVYQKTYLLGLKEYEGMGA